MNGYEIFLASVIAINVRHRSEGRQTASEPPVYQTGRIVCDANASAVRCRHGEFRQREVRRPASLYIACDGKHADGTRARAIMIVVLCELRIKENVRRGNSGEALLLLLFSQRENRNCAARCRT